jgi:hypothetical protein
MEHGLEIDETLRQPCAALAPEIIEESFVIVSQSGFRQSF